MTTQTTRSDRSLYNSDSFTQAFPLQIRQVLLVRANSQYQDGHCPDCGKTIQCVDVNENNHFVIRHVSDVRGRGDYCTVVPDSSDFAWPESEVSDDA